MKKIMLLLLALLFAGVMTVECRADGETVKETKKTASKEKKKGSRKSRRQKKNQALKNARSAAAVMREIKEIHKLQTKLLNCKEDAVQAEKVTAAIQQIVKKNAPLFKKFGKIEGIDMAGDIGKLVQEGKKLASEGEEITDAAALERLQKKQLELIEKLRKGEK